MEISSTMHWQGDNAPGNQFIRVRKAYFIDKNQDSIQYSAIDKIFGFCVEYELLTDAPFFTHGINVYNDRDIHLFTSHDDQKYENKSVILKGTYMTVAWIPANILQNGDISFSFACFRYDPFEVLFHTSEIARITIIDAMDSPTRNENYRGGLPGLVRPRLSWNKIKRIS